MDGTGSVDDSYIWGDALAELQDVRPDARVLNLETSITAFTGSFSK